MKLIIKKGATSQTVNVFIQDSSSTTGAGKTGLAFNTASLTAYYARPRAAAVAITLATQTVTGAWSSGGFVEIDATNMPGWYRFDPPDAIFASGVDSAAIHLKGATNMAPLPIEVQLVAYDPQDATALGLSRIDAAISSRSSHSAADVWAVGTRALTDKAGFSLSSAGIQAIWDALTSALTTASSIGKLLVDNVNATISSRSSHTAADTWTVGTRALTDKAGFSLAADQSGVTVGTVNALGTQAKADVNAEVDSALDTAIPTTPTANSINERVKTLDDSYTTTRAGNLDNLDATVSSRLASASISLSGGAVTVGTNNDKTGYRLSATGVDDVLDEVVEGAYTFRQYLRLFASALAAKLSGAATATVTIRDTGDTKNRIVAAVDSDGNRTSVTLDAT